MKRIQLNTATKILSICTLLLALSGTGKAQPCKDEVRDLYRQFDQYVMQQEAQNFAVTYSMHSSQHPGGEASRIEAKSYAGRAHSKNQYLESYQDEENVVVVFAQNKEIFIAHKDDPKYAMLQKQNFQVFQDSMFQKMTQASCKELQQNGKAIKQVVLTPNAQLQKSMGLQNMEFGINQKTNQFDYIKVNYVVNDAIQFMELKIHSLDLDYKKEVFTGSAVSQVLDSSGALRKGYEGYEVSDYR